MATNEAATLAKIAPGIIEHVNDDHLADLLAMAHAFAQCTWATDAHLQGIELDRLDVVVRDATREAQIDIPFDPPLAKAKDVRNRFIELHERAQALLATGTAVS